MYKSCLPPGMGNSHCLTVCSVAVSSKRILQDPSAFADNGVRFPSWLNAANRGSGGLNEAHFLRRDELPRLCIVEAKTIYKT